MRARLPVTALRDVLAPVDALVNEAVVYTNSDGLVLHALAANKSASVTVALSTEATSTFTPGNQPFGIDIQRPTSFLDYLSDSTLVTITGPPLSDRFTLSTLDSTYRADCTDPNTIYQRSRGDLGQACTATFVVPSKSIPLKQSLGAADLCGETITIQTRDDSMVQFTATGDTDSMTSTLTQDDLLSSWGDATSGTYSINKLLEMYNGLDTRTDYLQFAIDTTSSLIFTGTHPNTAISTQYILSSYAHTIA